MQYSSYSLEQLNADYPKYEMLCNAFLRLAQDEETLEKLKEILYRGIWQQYSVSSNMERRNSPYIEIERRLGMARLLLSEPETFQFFVDHQVKFFHGTRANALPGILQYGLNSVNTLQEMGIAVETGESWSRIQGKRPFVSFSDVYDISENYSMILSKEGKAKSSFGVMIATSEEEIRKQKVVNIASDISEIGIYGGMPLESIQCICVPRSRVNFVRKMVGDRNIPVLAMPDPSEKFYFGREIFSQEKYEKFARMQKRNLGKVFGKEEIGELAITRTFQKIKSAFDKLQNIFLEGGEDRIGRRI